MGLEEDRAFDGHDFLKPHDHRTGGAARAVVLLVENLSFVKHLVSGMVAMACTQVGLQVWQKKATKSEFEIEFFESILQFFENDFTPATGNQWNDSWKISLSLYLYTS